MSPPVSPAVRSRSDRLARVLRAAFRTTTASRTPTTAPAATEARRDLGGLDLSRRPVVLIECADMRNRHAALMTSAASRQRIAAGIVRGKRLPAAMNG